MGSMSSDAGVNNELPLVAAGSRDLRASRFPALPRCDNQRSRSDYTLRHSRSCAVPNSFMPSSKAISARNPRLRLARCGSAVI